MIISEESYLAHYGVARRSGRYPYGSGGNESTPRSMTFLDYVAQLHKDGMTETEIATGLGITTTQLRADKAIAKTAKRQSDILMAQRLKDKGTATTAIGERMGLPESTVRGLLSQGAADKADILMSTSNMLKQQVAEKKFIDVGTGVERHLNISATKLSTAVSILKDEGYEEFNINVEQLGTGLQTRFKVLTPPGTTFKELAQNKTDIRQITEWSEDGGRSFLGMKPPLNVDSKRIDVKWSEDGGSDADGMIYIRPGVQDISLGGANYAQVRVAVDGTHYLKGVAIYKDDLPAGVDIQVNSNKPRNADKHKAFKPMTDDVDNPFGAVVKQKFNEDGSVKTAMNIVNEEGDWESWGKSLSSQMLSKQSPRLAKTQLDLTYQNKKDEFEEIAALTNPAVRRKLLQSYSDAVDSSAVHLEAASVSRQSTHVIIPINSLKDNEIYAPNYRNGERVALVRYPHGGTFEIPELTVNNNHPEGKSVLSRAKDAVGINSKVAARMSGADYDGDFVLVLPNNDGQIKSTPALSGLKGFDPQSAYPKYPGMKPMVNREKQMQMGDISNLITDMTIRQATPSEIARAVRHSMVVIDAEKHELNYRQSAVDNGIKQLKTKYQGAPTAGASTLISRATSEKRVAERKPRPAADGGPIDKKTGKLVYVETGRTYTTQKTSKTGVVKDKITPHTTKSKKLAETSDAYTLSSGTPMERLYADHSNKMKALANQARLEMVNTKDRPYSPSAKMAYPDEVRSLNASLNTVLRNRPYERNAQLLATTIVKAKKASNPDMPAEQLKKIKGQALTEARSRSGPARQRVAISDREWEAIQAGAISPNKLSQILDKADLSEVKKLATPRTPLLMTSTKTARAQAMFDSGYTQAEIASALGVSLTTLKTVL